MSTVVLVRPGCTDFDEQKRIQGSLELPLNDRGYGQLAKVIDVIRDQPVKAVITGPCEPCRSTAEAVAHALDVTIKEKQALCNLDQGLWQGLCIDEIRKKFPKVFKQWKEAPETVCPPEGETETLASSSRRSTMLRTTWSSVRQTRASSGTRRWPCRSTVRS